MSDEQPKKLGAFDFVNQISHGGEYLMESEEDEKQYVPYLAARHLSMFPDCILAVNELNAGHVEDKRMHHDALFVGIRKRKRFSKWPKKEENQLIELIKQEYAVNQKRAEEMAGMMSDDEKKDLIDMYDEGG